MNVLECSSTEKMKRLKIKQNLRTMDEDLGEPAGEGNIENNSTLSGMYGNNVKITISS